MRYLGAILTMVGLRLLVGVWTENFSTWWDIGLTGLGTVLFLAGLEITIKQYSKPRPVKR